MLSSRNCVVLSAVLLVSLLMAAPARAQAVDLWCTPVDDKGKDIDGYGIWVTFDERAGTVVVGDGPVSRGRFTDKTITWNHVDDPTPSIPRNRSTIYYSLNRETGILNLDRAYITGIPSYPTGHSYCHYKCAVDKKGAQKKKF
jgi:hypothetical protein